MTDKITLDRAVVELALAWLEALTSDTGRFESEVPPIAALRAALAEQPAEQKPAIRCTYPLCKTTAGCSGVCSKAVPYTAPQPQREWVGLTDEEVAVMMMESWGCASIAPRHAPAFARAIEAKLREKNT